MSSNLWWFNSWRSPDSLPLSFLFPPQPSPPLLFTIPNSKKTYLSQNLKLLPPLVKVDQAVRDDVGDGRVDHREVGEEGAQVWDRAIAAMETFSKEVFDPALPDSPTVLNVFLQNFLQMMIFFPRCVGKLCRPLPAEETFTTDPFVSFPSLVWT